MESTRYLMCVVLSMVAKGGAIEKVLFWKVAHRSLLSTNSTCGLYNANNLDEFMCGVVCMNRGCVNYQFVPKGKLCIICGDITGMQAYTDPLPDAKGQIWEKIACGLPVLANGSVTVDKTTPGGQAIHSCNPGFRPTGEVTRTCKDDGQWNSQMPYCQKECSYFYQQESCYHVSVIEVKRSEAYQECLSRNMELLSLETWQEYMFIADILKRDFPTEKFWVSAQGNINSKYSWRFSNGTTKSIDYQGNDPWISGEPNDGGTGTYCVDIKEKNGRYGLSNLFCETNRYKKSIICEKNI